MAQRLCAIVDAQIMKATRINYEQIGYTLTRVTQDIFSAATAFDTTQRMLNPNADAGEGLVPLFLFGGQFAPARLFFGCRTRTSAGW